MRITFTHFFGKKRSKTGKIWYFDSFRQLSCQKKGSNVIRFKFSDQIWDLLIIQQLSYPNMLEFAQFDFLVSQSIFKISIALGGGIDRTFWGKQTIPR